MTSGNPEVKIAAVEELVRDGGSLDDALVLTGIGRRRQFLRWLERHGRLDLRMHFEAVC